LIIIDETPGLRPCTGFWTHQNTPRPLRGGAERSAEPRGEVSQRRRCPHSVCGGRGAVGGSSTAPATALPACGREHHPVYSTPGVRRWASPGLQHSRRAAV